MRKTRPGRWTGWTRPKPIARRALSLLDRIEPDGGPGRPPPVRTLRLHVRSQRFRHARLMQGLRLTVA